MRFAHTLSLAASTLTLTLAFAPLRDAEACGGCFHVPAENTEVASHRMVLSVSQAQSTLYDQIAYSGVPSSFAWVLPVKGTVTIGLSSDALFAELDQLTQVTVSAPNLPCPSCNASSGFSAGASGSSTGTGVTVVAQMVVGPYETVQLSSADPTALTAWLTMHGYAIPTDVKPIIAAYVGEGFDFLALKLVPGMSVTAMKPVRVTTPGASPVLPLRMVAAGAGVTVPITLFVVGEGRYEPANLPWFTVDASKLVWDFATNSSNYKKLRQDGFTASAGKAWLIESAQPTSEPQITSDITQLVTIDPMHSGYADSMGNGAPKAAQDDLATLFGGINASSLWITRLLAELPRTSLSTDLTLGAAASQMSVPNALAAAKYINAPPCPCGTATGTGSGTGGTSGDGTTGVGTTGAGMIGAGGAGGTGGGGGCGIGRAGETPFALYGVVAALALAGARRRRAR